jgi:hypothetical protein
MPYLEQLRHRNVNNKIVIASMLEMVPLCNGAASNDML